MGERDKHPWGRSIGLKSSRIDTIFKGNVPQADALERIQSGERVSVDWLLTGIGAPYLVEIYGSDAKTAQALAERLDSVPDLKAYLLLDGAGEAAVVVTRPVKHRWEDGNEADYIDAEVFANAGPLTIEAAGHKGKHYVLQVSPEVLRQLRNGWLGKRDLLGDGSEPGLLAPARSVSQGEVHKVAEQVGRYKAGPSDEAQLLEHFRRIPPRARAALFELLRAMDPTVDVNQLPPGEVLNPDEEEEADRNRTRDTEGAYKA